MVVMVNMECKNKNEINLSWIYFVLLNQVGNQSLICTSQLTGADLGFFIRQSNAKGVRPSRGVRGHAPPGKF